MRACVCVHECVCVCMLLPHPPSPYASPAQCHAPPPMLMVPHISLPCVQVAGSMEKPPALITITDAYDSLPVSASARTKAHLARICIISCSSHREYICTFGQDLHHFFNFVHLARIWLFPPRVHLYIWPGFVSFQALPAERLALESVTEVADFDAISISTMADEDNYDDDDDDDEEEGEEGEELTCSLQ